MTIQRIIRDRPLMPEEAAKYKAIREQIAEELPELVARHEERLAIHNDDAGRRP
jgi:hypothetical protein